MANNLFNTIRIKPPKRNKFNLSHSVKMSTKFGNLVPIFCQPVLPGDTFNMNTEILCRFAPFQAPVMHKVKVYTHFFYVPNRLVWSNWKDFITGGEDGTSNVVYPRLRLDGPFRNSTFGKELFIDGSLADYLGFPTPGKYGVIDGTDCDLDALPFRAYQLIYNEFYRDQNVTDPIDIDRDSDGIIRLQTTSSQLQLLKLRKRSWKKDYFTSALPFSQRGDDVTLPLYGDITLSTKPGASYFTIPGINTVYTPSDKGLNSSGGDPLTVDAPSRNSPNRATFSAKGGDGSNVESYLTNFSESDTPAIKVPLSDSVMNAIQSRLGIDLDHVSAATINELRRAISAQSFLEAMARGGSRYIEQLYTIFGVKSSDARLQRPEFLGGGQSNVVISDVLQTSETTEGNPLATPAGHGVSVQGTHQFKRFFEEHGYVIGIMSIMPMPAYQQGMPRVFSKFDRLDYYWPQFAHLGEQEITEGEIFYTGNSNKDSKTFGYTPRYAEYKYIPDSVHGDFKGSLNFWHMGRIFSTPPQLNEDFLTNVQSANRPFSVQDDQYDKIWVNIHHNLIAKRPMPVYGTPML